MKFSAAAWLLLALAACARAGDVFKILVVVPMPAGSHSILGDGIVRNLAAAGHQITYITAIPNKKHPPNVRQVDVSTNFNYIDSNQLSIKAIINKDFEMSTSSMNVMMQLIHNGTYNNPNVQALLNNPDEHFDLVITEWMFSEQFCGFASIFNAPHVWLSTCEPHWMVTQLIDESLHPAYNSDLMSSRVPPFNFYERVEQLFTQIMVSVMRYYHSSQQDLDLFDSLGKYYRLRGREPPAYNELKYNASLMLGNSHVSLGLPTRLPASYKNIGGYHIDRNVAPLPADLQKLLDDAKHGLIYFSMGSNLKSKDWPEQLKRDLLKVFGTLKQTVLWKFEETLPNLPSNVHIMKWAPQPSILAHPNCILFITHGGLLSTTEAIHFAKPIIGIPAFADQFTNVDRAVKKGFAKRVDLSYALGEDLKVALDDVLHNPAYTNKAKELSFIYHDRPITPGAELVHWVEHVIKTKGAPHLRSAAINMPFYQKMYLDLAASILAVLYLIRAVFRSIFKKSSEKVKTN